MPGDGVDDCYVDGDFDEYGSDEIIAANSLDCEARPGFSTMNDDCNDDDGDINPDATGVPGNDIDEDCNSVDTCYVDKDGDGYGSTTEAEGEALNCDNSQNLSSNPDDCNDDNWDISPGASETTGDNIDYNCNDDNDT